MTPVTVTTREEHEVFDAEDLVVLSGVEVVRGGGSDGGGLRMVKHKSRRYNYNNSTRDAEETKAEEIKWIL